MMKKLWYETAGFINCRNADSIWTMVEQQYSKTGRHYHNLSHLDTIAENLIGWQEATGKSINVETVVAAMFHDYIYDPTKPDNEVRSSVVADGIRKSLGLNWVSGGIITNLITCTKSHEIPTSFVEGMKVIVATFLDTDLCILGYGEEVYSSYKSAVRKEYSFVTDQVFTKARIKFIMSFLNRSSIYFTEYFKTKYEEKARYNLTEELKTLKEVSLG